MTKFENDDIYTAAADWKAKGLNVVCIPTVNGHPSKYPTQTDWHIIAAENGYLPDDFRKPCNIGILLGGSKNVADVDVDAMFALPIAAEILAELFPKTFCFGRKSKLLSHYIHFLSESLPSVEIIDPLTGKMVIESRCLSKGGTRSRESVIPPSKHYDPKTGAEEQIEVDPSSAAEIAAVSGKKLVKAVEYIGAVALLANCFPLTGNRHNAILALAGLLARAGKPVGYALDVIVRAYKHSKGFNHDVSKESDIKGVYKSFDKSPDTHLYGYPTLVQIFPAKVIEKVLGLLEIERSSAKRPSTL